MSWKPGSPPNVLTCHPLLLQVYSQSLSHQLSDATGFTAITARAAPALWDLPWCQSESYTPLECVPLPLNLPTIHQANNLLSYCHSPPSLPWWENFLGNHCFPLYASPFRTSSEHIDCSLGPDTHLLLPCHTLTCLLTSPTPSAACSAIWHFCPLFSHTRLRLQELTTA